MLLHQILSLPDDELQLVLCSLAGLPDKACNQDIVRSGSDNASDNTSHERDPPVGLETECFRWQFPSVDTCVHGYRLHAHEEEDEGLSEEIWLVKK